MASQQSTETARPTLSPPDLVVVQDPDSPAAQAYRTVRESLRHARKEQPLRSVFLADPGTQGQSGEAVANLAASFALNGDPVVAVDGDASSPTLHALLNTPLSPGLVEWLSGHAGNEPLTPMATGIDGLMLLPAGERSSGAGRSMSDMLTGNACERLAGELGTNARYVLFNAPPLTESSEGLTIAANVDAVLLLVRSGTTKRTDAQRARESLERVGATVLGVLLTDT